MWEKFKLYTKMTVFGAMALYVLAFIFMNRERAVDGELKLIFTTFNRPSILLVLPITAVLSIIAWWLVRTIFKTVRQFRTLRERSRTAKLEKEVADMKAKAGMLQTREIPPSTPAANTTSTTTSPEP